MNLDIDLKSLLVGVVLVLCVLLAVGASSPAILHHAGRYQLVVAEGHGAYILDSHTGRVWREHPSENKFGELKIDTTLPSDGHR